MRRVFDWFIVLLAAAFGGVCLWPSDSRSLPLLLLVAAIVLLGLSRESVIPRAAAMMLGVVAVTVVAESTIRSSLAGYDTRLAWTAVLSALLLRGDRLRAHTITAVGIMTVTLVPPTDIALLRVAPPVLLQVFICAIIVALQRVDASTRLWWRFYRVIEPFAGVVVIAVAILPFRKNGLGAMELIKWHLPVAIVASLIGLLVEVTFRLQPRLAQDAGRD